MNPEEWLQKVIHHIEQLEKLSKENITPISDEIDNKIFWLQENIKNALRLIHVELVS